MTQEQQRLTILIREAKLLSVYSGIDWSSHRWNLTSYVNRRAHDKRQLNVHFAHLRKTRSDPYLSLPRRFADFSKALIRIRASEKNSSWDSQKHMADALRYLNEAMILSSTNDPTKLRAVHFYNALQYASSRLGHRGLYHLSHAFAEIVSFLNDRRLTSVKITFRNTVSHPSQYDGLDSESQARGLAKMPSQNALRALAEASKSPIDDNERILLRTIDLLVLGNFRVGEVLTLPAACWVVEVQPSKERPSDTDQQEGETTNRYGLRYWPEKGGEPIVKWLPDVAVPVARRAIEELTELCAEARQAAAVLELNPGRVPLAGFLPEDLVDRKTLREVFGLTYGGLREFEVHCGLTPLQREREKFRGGNRNLYRVGDIEKALSKRLQRLKVVLKPDGKHLKLSECLCVVFCNQYRGTKPTFKMLPELLTYKQVSAALGSDSWAISIFDRRGLKEPDGEPMRIRTHAFRHYCNTLADRGGLSDLELALWSGRRDPRQNAAYKHGTVEQRVQWAREMLQSGKLYGSIAKVYADMKDPIEKQEFLKTFMTMAHFTPYGVCVHDFASEPCQYHLNCLGGCPEYLRTKGDNAERKQLLQLKRFVATELDVAERAMETGTFNASNWVNYNQRLLANTEAALAVDDQPEPCGTKIQVFSDGKPKGSQLYA